MSKPKNYDDLVEQYIQGERETYELLGGDFPDKGNAENFIKDLLSTDFDQDYFDATWDATFSAVKKPQPTFLADKPVREMSKQEYDRFFQDYTSPIKGQVEELFSFEPSDPIVQHDLLKNAQTFGNIEDLLEQKIEKKIQDGDGSKVSKQKISQEVYTNTFGGDFPKTKEGYQFHDALGLTEKQFLSLPKEQKYQILLNLQSNAGIDKLSPLDKIYNIALSQDTEEINLQNFGHTKEASQDKYAVYEKYKNLAKSMDLNSNDGLVDTFLNTMKTGEEEFRNANVFASTMFSPKTADLFNNYQKAIAEIYLEQLELVKKEPQNLDMPKIEENQMVLYGLVQNINELIPNKDMLLSFDSVLVPIPEDLSSLETDSFGRPLPQFNMVEQHNLRLSRLSNPSDFTPNAIQRILDYGGGIHFDPVEQSEWYEKLGDLFSSSLASISEEKFFPYAGSQKLLIQQIENRISDLKRSDINSPEIQQLEEAKNKISNIPLGELDLTTGSEFLQTLSTLGGEYVDEMISQLGYKDTNYFDNYEEAMNKIRQINLEADSDMSEIEHLEAMIYAMQTIETGFLDSAVDVNEVSLDHERPRLLEMTPEAFLRDPQINQRKFGTLPKIMQLILMQNITSYIPQYAKGREDIDIDDVTLEWLNDKTIETIDIATDLRKNLDSDDLKRFVEYRDKIVLSAPGTLNQFLMDIGSTPTFNPREQTFTKEVNSLGKLLYHVAPLANRAVIEGTPIINARSLEELSKGNVAAAASIGFYAEPLLDAYNDTGGYSDLPSFSSTVAAKIAVGDPGLMGDLPYLVHLFEGGEAQQKASEYLGLGLDFLIPGERIVISPVRRATSHVSRYVYPKSIDTETTGVSPIFREASIDASVERPNGTFQNVLVPISMIADTALYGSGLGLALDMSVQGYQKFTKPSVSNKVNPKNVKNYTKLTEKQQQYIQKTIEDKVAQDRPFTFLEVLQKEHDFNFGVLLDDGLDIKNPEIYAKSKFPNDEVKQAELSRNIKKDIGALRLHLDQLGVDLDDAFQKYKANEIHNAPDILTNSHRIYLENTEIPSSVKKTESFKNAESYIFNRTDLSEAEKSSWIHHLYVYGSLLYPDNPSEFFKTVYFEPKKQASKSDQSFVGVTDFYKKSEDSNVTANDLVDSLGEEAVSTRGVRSFVAKSEVDGIPVLFDSSKPNVAPIEKSTIIKHYGRSLNRGSKTELHGRKGNILTERFLDSQYKDIQGRKTKMEVEKDVVNLLRIEDELIENQKLETDPESIAETAKQLKEIRKQLDDRKDARSLRNRYKRATEQLEYIEDLGSERYLLNERINKRDVRIRKSKRFKLSEEEKAQIEGKMEIDSDLLMQRETQLSGAKLKEQRRLLREIGVDYRKKSKQIISEEIATLRKRLEATEDFNERQRIIEQIQTKTRNNNRVFYNQGLQENIKTYTLGNKQEQALVRFVDENDSTYRVETMRGQWAQKNKLDLNKELYWRSEISKAIIEDASYNGYNTVTIPLGDFGIFHETLGRRIRTKDYNLLVQNQDVLTAKMKQRNLLLAEIRDGSDESTMSARIEQINKINEEIDSALETDKNIKDNFIFTERNKNLSKIEERFIELIEQYVSDIDNNIRFEVDDDGVTIHLTETFRNAIGRTIEEEPTVYFDKNTKFLDAESDLEPLPRIDIDPERLEATKAARQKLQQESKTLERQIEKHKNTPNTIRVENTNIKIELQKLKEYQDTGYFESDGSVRFFRRSDNKIVISIGEYNIVARNFEKNGKKGFLFETIFNKATGEEIQQTLNVSQTRSALFDNFKSQSLIFDQEIKNFIDYQKHFYAYTSEQKLTNFPFTREQYLQLRKKLGVKTEPKSGDKFFLGHLLDGKMVKSKEKGKSRQRVLDTTFIDEEFAVAFRDKGNKFRDSFVEQGIDQKMFVRGKTKYRESKAMLTELKRHTKSVLKRFEQKHEKINAMVYRYSNTNISDYKKILETNQYLRMESLSVSQTTKLLTELLSRDYEIFSFDSASGHMFQNFADIFDQVGGRSSPDLLKIEKQVYPTLNLGLTKDKTKSFFGQELIASINSDIKIAIDYLGRKQLSATEEAKLNTIRKIFNVDQNFSLQKEILKGHNDLYQTYQPKRTSNTYHGLRKKSVSRLIDGIDEAIRTLKRNDSATDLLVQKRDELKRQFTAYQRLEEEAIVFDLGGDAVHSDILFFAEDQTNGAGRMQGIMSDITRFRFTGDPSRATVSYVKNMVLDSVQLGFDSIGFERSLEGTLSVSILEGIASRFGKKLEKTSVFDNSGEVLQRYDFITFKFPKELKNNVSNMSGIRFVRSIETSDPVRINGSHIFKLIEEGQLKVRTPYGDLELVLTQNKITEDTKNAVQEIVFNINNAINRIDYYNRFDSTLFENVDPSLASDYQQSLYAKGVANEFKESLQNYISFEIKGLDEIENVTITRLERASKPNRGTIAFNGKEVNVLVEHVPTRPLSQLELVALNEGIGLNDTLKLMQESLLVAKNDIDQVKKLLGLQISTKQISDVLNERKIPSGFLDSEFSKHPQAIFSPLLPLLYLEFETLRDPNIKRIYSYDAKLLDTNIKPTIERAIIDEGDVISQIEIDGNRLRVRLSDTMTLNDFLVTNANILEMMMPAKAYKHLASSFDSVNGRLTESGVKQFASEFTYYINSDIAPDLRTRAIMDHSLGYLSKYWDLIHNKPVPETMKTQWNTIFNPHGKSVLQAIEIGKKKPKYKIRLKIDDDKLAALRAKPSLQAVSKLREVSAVPTRKVLFEMLNKSPSIRTLKRKITDSTGRPTYTFGQIKPNDNIDPKLLMTSVYGIIKSEEYKKTPILQRKGGFVNSLARIIDYFNTENVERLTAKHYVPSSIKRQVQRQVANQKMIIFGDDYLQRIERDPNKNLSLNENQQQRFVSVLNSLADEDHGFPQSLIDYAFEPRDFITKEELNSFTDGLLNREVPYGFSNRKIDVNNAKRTSHFFKTQWKSWTKQAESVDILNRGLNYITTTFEKYFLRDQTLTEIPPTLEPEFRQLIGELKGVSQRITRKMREIAYDVEEGKDIRRSLEQRKVDNVEIDNIIESFFNRNDTFKKIANIEIIVNENLKKLAKVDPEKLGLFYRLYDEIFNLGLKDKNIYDIFTLEKLQEIENVLTSREFGISDTEHLAVNIMRDIGIEYKKFKEQFPNQSFKLGQEKAHSYLSAVNELQKAITSRYNYLDQIGDDVFRRFTGYTKEDSSLSQYTSVINRQLLTLLLKGRYIHHPGINIVSRFLTVDDVFTTTNAGDIVFKGSGIKLTQESAKQFLFDNGYGFIDTADNIKLHRQIQDEIPKMGTINDLAEAITEVLRHKEANSIQTFLASDTKILNNLLGISPENARSDMLAVLGGLAIMTEERLAFQGLAKRLSSNMFQDLDSRLSRRKELYGNYYIDEIESFKESVIHHVNQMVSGNFHRNPSENVASKPIMLVDGILPEANASLREAEAYAIAMDILKDLELPIIASRKLVGQIEIDGQVYILPKDFINGLQNIRDNVVGNISLGKYGETEIYDNLVIYEAQRETRTNLVPPEEQKRILKTLGKEQSILRDAIIPSLEKSILYAIPITGITAFLNFLGADINNLIPGTAIFLAGSTEALKFDVLRNYISGKLGQVFGDKINMLQNKHIADTILHQLVTHTYHVYDNADKKKIMAIKQKYEGMIPPRIEQKLRGYIYTGQVAATVGVTALVNPYLGILLGLGSLAVNDVVLSGGYSKSIIDMIRSKGATETFIREIQDLYNNRQAKIVQELSNMTLSEQSQKNLRRYLNEHQRLVKYIEAPPSRQNIMTRNIDRVIKEFADAFSLDKISTNIKMSVTALSGPQYWTTNWFGMINQLHLDEGLNRRFLAATAGFSASYALTGSVALSIPASRLSVVVADAMVGSKRFTFGRSKNNNMYKGPSAHQRPKQIAMMLNDIQETSLSTRMGVSEGFYIGLGITGLFGAGVGVATGLTAAAAIKIGLDQVIKNAKAKRAKNKFVVFTPEGKTYGYNDIMKYMQTYDVLTTYVREETGQIIASEARNLYPTFFENLNQNFNRSAMEVAEAYDLYFRIGKFIDDLEQGFSPKESADRVRSMYFDYSDLSDFEKNYLRNIFLFYSFMRKNMAFMARKFLENPERVSSWLRLTKGTQEMAYDREYSKLLVGDFWQARAVIPPLEGIFADFKRNAVPGKHESTIIFPMTNVYDSMMFMSAVIENPLSDNDKGFRRYILTSLGPQTQSLIIPFTDEIPFTEMPVRYMKISPRMRELSQKIFGLNLYAPEGTKDALIKYKSQTLEESLQGRTLATAERRAMKGLLPIAEGRTYTPATNADGYKHFLLNDVFFPATHVHPLGKLAFMFNPTGRPSRAYEALDRMDFLEQIVGASLITHGCRLLGLQTSDEVLAEAQMLLAREGRDYQDPKLVAETAKELIRRAILVENKNVNLSNETIIQMDVMCEQYILTDNTPYNGLLSRLIGLPSIDNPSMESIRYQMMNILEQKSKGPRDD